jgi:2-polyprenyl-3-methyl-5-hydroxy-6-metoxy-1,4-benzoquinol methylase
MMPWPPALTRRHIEPELLGNASPAEIEANLGDLRRINRYFGGMPTLRSALRPFRRPGLRILDVGAASGDHAAALAGARVVSLDLSPAHLIQAPGDRVVADAFALPFAPASFDIVMANLFLHHFEDAAIVALLRQFARVATEGIIINDLERSRLAWSFLPLTAPLLGWHAITLHDGPVSVAAGFRPAELAALFSRAGLDGVRVRRHWPWFRLSAVWRPYGSAKAI